jgi:hypothetical protein
MNEVLVNVDSSLELKSIQYVVIGRTGMMESSSYIDVFTKKELEIPIKFKTWMIPEAQILVYYIHFTGELVYDTSTMKFEQELLNHVKSCSLTVGIEFLKNVFILS